MIYKIFLVIVFFLNSSSFGFCAKYSFNRDLESGYLTNKCQVCDVSYSDVFKSLYKGYDSFFCDQIGKFKIQIQSEMSKSLQMEVFDPFGPTGLFYDGISKVPLKNPLSLSEFVISSLFRNSEEREKALKFFSVFDLHDLLEEKISEHFSGATTPGDLNRNIAEMAINSVLGKMDSYSLDKNFEEVETDVLNSARMEFSLQDYREEHLKKTIEKWGNNDVVNYILYELKTRINCEMLKAFSVLCDSISSDITSFERESLVDLVSQLAFCIGANFFPTKKIIVAGCAIASKAALSLQPYSFSFDMKGLKNTIKKLLGYAGSVFSITFDDVAKYHMEFLFNNNSLSSHNMDEWEQLYFKKLYPIEILLKKIAVDSKKS